MEATFSLDTSRQHLALMGRISEKRLESLFKFDEDMFHLIVDILLGD